MKRDDKKKTFFWLWCIEGCIVGMLMGGIVLAVFITLLLTSKSTTTNRASICTLPLNNTFTFERINGRLNRPVDFQSSTMMRQLQVVSRGEYD
jgi:hypothetical protein